VAEWKPGVIERESALRAVARLEPQCNGARVSTTSGGGLEPVVMERESATTSGGEIGTRW
jgi:hypothetical protein